VNFPVPIGEPQAYQQHLPGLRMLWTSLPPPLVDGLVVVADDTEVRADQIHPGTWHWTLRDLVTTHLRWLVPSPSRQVTGIDGKPRVVLRSKLAAQTARDLLTCTSAPDS